MLMWKDEAPDRVSCNILQIKRHLNHRHLPWTINCWPTTLPSPPHRRFIWTVAAIAAGHLPLLTSSQLNLCRRY